MRNHSNKLNRETCPEKILINRYVLHQCSQEERQQMEAHLIKCSLCRRTVVFLAKTKSETEEEDRWDEVPEQILNKSMELVKHFQRSYFPNYERVKQLVKDFQGLTLEIILKFTNGHWKVSRHTGTYLPQPVLAGRKESVKGKMVLSPPIAKEFKGYRLEVMPEENKEGNIDLQIKVKDLFQADLISQLHFILCDEDKQRISEDFIQDGVAFFEGLKSGKYSIEIFQQDKPIGHIPLNIPPK